MATMLVMCAPELLRSSCVTVLGVATGRTEVSAGRPLEAQWIMPGERSLRRYVIYSFAPVEYGELQIAQTVDLWHFAFENTRPESSNQFNLLSCAVPMRQQVGRLEQQAIPIPVGGDRTQIRSVDEPGNVTYRIVGGY